MRAFRRRRRTWCFHVGRVRCRHRCCSRSRFAASVASARRGTVAFGLQQPGQTGWRRTRPPPLLTTVRCRRRLSAVYLISIHIQYYYTQYTSHTQERSDTSPPLPARPFRNVHYSPSHHAVRPGCPFPTASSPCPPFDFPLSFVCVCVYVCVRATVRRERRACTSCTMSVRACGGGTVSGQRLSVCPFGTPRAALSARPTRTPLSDTVASAAPHCHLHTARSVARKPERSHIFRYPPEKWARKFRAPDKKKINTKYLYLYWYTRCGRTGWQRASIVVWNGGA